MSIRPKPAGILVALLLASGTVAAPGQAQQTPPEGCREPGLTIESRIKGDIPLGGPIALASWRELQRDVTLEEFIAGRLAPLGYEVDPDAFWRLVYETDDQPAGIDRRFSIYSEVQGGKEPAAQGQYRFDRGSDGCPPTSVYLMNVQIEDDGGRVVWRATATHVTQATEPTADKERLARRLISQLRADLRDTHNQPGGAD